MEVNSQPQATTSAVAVRYGLLLGLVLIIYSFALMATDQITNPVLGGVVYLLMIIGIVVAMRAFKAGNGGFMSYGEGLGVGVLVSLIAGTLSSLFSYVYQTFIDPGMKERLAEQMRMKLEEAGTMSDEQIDQMIAMTQKFSGGPISVIGGIVFLAFLGLLFSLVIAAIIKHTRPEFE